MNQKKLLDIKNKTPKELEAIALQWSGYHTPGVDAPNPLGYKARPLNGIWATAPYLHNGSVPNLYQLLLPARERVKDFYVGSRDFDTVNVGFKYAPGDNPGGFHFNTVDDGGKPIPGNANTGHEGKGYTGMRDENGYDRDFTEDERWALVEYMKTLK